MKILIINEVFGHTSTGKICAELADEYIAKGHEVKIVYGRDGYVPQKYKDNVIRIGNAMTVYMHAIRTRIMDEHGFGSYFATKKFLRWAEKFNPDMVWLHNLHGYYINIELLFDWIKKHSEMEVKWTLHDCWAFTGHCVHFSMIKCCKWRSHCEKCPQKSQYPTSKYKDNSYENFERKRQAFIGVKKMTIITPSNWLAELVGQSFLKVYPIEVIYNKINLDIFKPTPSTFRQDYALQNKRMILGVANVWDDRKGFYDFIKLSKMLEQQYVIVLVGVSDKQIREMPDNMIGIKRTKDQVELAGIYTTADLLLSLSKEETFGLTIIEALACGTEAMVLEGTACEEIVKKYGGMVIPNNNDFDFLYHMIVSYDYKDN